MIASPRIALDFGGLDALSAGSGQYRYLVDLVRGLQRLGPPYRFVVFGVRPGPPPELASVFESEAGEVALPAGAETAWVRGVLPGSTPDGGRPGRRRTSPCATACTRWCRCWPPARSW